MHSSWDALLSHCYRVRNVSLEMCVCVCVCVCAGVEGGVGERVVGKLLSAGKRVRVLTRDKSATTQRLVRLDCIV